MLAMYLVKLRGRGTLYRAGHLVATVRYDLWYRPDLGWIGTLETDSQGAAFVAEEKLWLYLPDDAHWLAVVPRGQYPFYLVSSMLPLQDHPTDQGGEPVERFQQHTELVRRARAQRRCQICRSRQASITVSSWTTGPDGPSPAISHYFCTDHAAEAEALLNLLQPPAAEF
jgi:hypothetical protein